MLEEAKKALRVTAAAYDSEIASLLMAGARGLMIAGVQLPGAVAFSVSGDTVTVASHIEDSAAINKLLCDRGIAVSQLIIHAETLEQYFMRKVGE